LNRGVVTNDDGYISIYCCYIILQCSAHYNIAIFNSLLPESSVLSVQSLLPASPESDGRVLLLLFKSSHGCSRTAVSFPQKLRFSMARVAPGPSRSLSPTGTATVAPTPNNWESGFFDVCASGFLDMCQAHFFPCITYAQNEEMLKLRENPQAPPTPSGFFHRVPFYACLLCCGAHCVLHQRYRLRIRSLYQIQYGPYGDSGDFLMSW
jgi:hypothetical protein